MIAAFAQTDWLVPLYPLVASLLSFLWSPGLIARTGPRPCGYINLLFVFLSFVHSTLALVGLHSVPVQASGRLTANLSAAEPLTAARSPLRIDSAQPLHRHP